MSPAIRCQAEIKPGENGSSQEDDDEYFLKRKSTMFYRDINYLF
jgi:hypothetical protein